MDSPLADKLNLNDVQTRCFWLEDRKKEIELFCKKLEKENIQIDIYTDTNKLVKSLKDRIVIYSVGIIDLLLEDISEEHGVNIAYELYGIYDDIFQ